MKLVKVERDVATRLRRLCDPLAECMPDGERLTQLIHAANEAADILEIVPYDDLSLHAPDRQVTEAMFNAAWNTLPSELYHCPHMTGTAMRQALKAAFAAGE